MLVQQKERKWKLSGNNDRTRTIIEDRKTKNFDDFFVKQCEKEKCFKLNR